MSAARTTLAAAVSGYDEAHERALVDSILTAICETARVSDAKCIALRTAETASALLTALALVLALRPAAARSPAAIRKTIDELGKRLRRRVASASADEALQDFVRRNFRGTDVGGNA